MHRFLWDIHYTAVPNVEPQFPISAQYRNTPPTPTSPRVMPGDYTVTLTINGKSLTQRLAVKMDPRGKTSFADLQDQFDLWRELYRLRLKRAPIGKNLDEITEQLTKLR